VDTEKSIKDLPEWPESIFDKSPSEMSEEEIRAMGKKGKIKSYWNKKPEKILKELGFNMEKEPIKIRPEEEEKPTFDLTIDERAMPFLRRVSFDKDKLIAAAKHQKADKVVYDLRYRTFDLYNNNKKFDTLPIGSF
jgi:hypothetical protein